MGPAHPCTCVLELREEKGIEKERKRKSPALGMTSCLWNLWSSLPTLSGSDFLSWPCSPARLPTLEMNLVSCIPGWKQARDPPSCLDLGLPSSGCLCHTFLIRLRGMVSQCTSPRSPDSIPTDDKRGHVLLVVYVLRASGGWCPPILVHHYVTDEETESLRG